MRRAGLNGILADDMGLGKTVQVVAYMLQVRAEQGGCVPSQPFLVAVPASVLSHWAGEIRRWAPSLQLLLYAGPAVKREEAFVRSVLPAARGKARIDVVLTTHDVLAGKTDAPRLRRLAYEALVVDEGHRLKNAACKLHAHLRAYRCRQRLLLTGRPRGCEYVIKRLPDGQSRHEPPLACASGTPLHNNLGELWALLNFLLPELFNSDDDFQTWCVGRVHENRHAARAAALFETNPVRQVWRSHARQAGSRPRCGGHGRADERCTLVRGRDFARRQSSAPGASTLRAAAAEERGRRRAPAQGRVPARRLESGENDKDALADQFPCVCREKYCSSVCHRPIKKLYFTCFLPE